MKLVFCLYIISVLTLNCTEVACGKLTGTWKEKYIKAKEKYADLGSLENIPCEFYYINLKMNSLNVDTVLVDSLHEEIYDERKKIGWKVIQVYDRKGHYLFSHGFNKKIYRQTGD